MSYACEELVKLKHIMDYISEILQDWEDMNYYEVQKNTDRSKFICELKFLQDCENLNLDEVLKYIKEGNDVNVKIGDNYALKIVLSSPMGFILLDLLLSSQTMDVNIKDDRGKTALMLACERGEAHLTEILLKVPEVDHNCQARNGYTAAMFAVYHGNDDCVKVLADSDDVDWNIQNHSGTTAVMLAICHNRSDYLKQMKNVQWNLRSNSGLSALTLALRKVRNSSIETKERWTSSAIHLVHILLAKPEIEIDIGHLEAMDVYEEALLQCKRFIYNKMVRNYKDYVASIHDVGRLFVYATVRDLNHIATVLIPSHPIAVKACRNFVGKMMNKDDTLHPEDNVTELLYALKKNLDRIASVLISRPTVDDILLLCKIHQHEQEKKRKFIEADESVEDVVPRKRILGESEEFSKILFQIMKERS